MAKKVVETKEPKPLMGETYRTILVGKIDAYKAKSGITSDSMLSRMIFGTDPSFIMDMRKGGNFTIEKGLRMERWIAHAEAMMAGEVPPGPLPPVRKEPKPKPEKKERTSKLKKEKTRTGKDALKAVRGKAVNKPVKPENVVDLKTGRTRRKKGEAA